MTPPPVYLRFRLGPPNEYVDDYGQVSRSSGSRILQATHYDPKNPDVLTWLDVPFDPVGWHGQEIAWTT